MAFRWFKNFIELVKFEHTLFALPFAYIGAFLAGGMAAPPKLLWITLAMIGARTAGMSLNRLIDLKYDSINPRTRERILPRKEMKISTVVLIIAASTALLLFSAWKLNPLCFLLSPAAIILLFIYSFTKRFTWMSHVVLGMILACAPVGGWIAVTGSIALAPLFLGAAVIFWVAGFDVIYACQDYDFDREAGLHSIPVKFGMEKGLAISAGFHFITVALLVLSGLSLKLNVIYFAGVAVSAGLLTYEHLLLAKRDLKNINRAFFTVNSWMSVVLFVFTALEKIVSV